jgi:membrane protein implicated in regulation of membrane protease activity
MPTRFIIYIANIVVAVPAYVAVLSLIYSTGGSLVVMTLLLLPVLVIQWMGLAALLAQLPPVKVAGAKTIVALVTVLASLLSGELIRLALKILY